jgi:dihydrofolate reductase
MTKVIIDLAISLDGFVAGPGDRPDEIFEWYFSGDTPIPQYEDAIAGGAPYPPFRLAADDLHVFQELIDNSGAVVTGRRTYDVSNAWGGYGPHPGVPLFVVTHEAPASVPDGPTTYTFVTDGVEAAVDRAKAAAGSKWVSLLGAAIAQQALGAGLVDEIQLHVAPVVLGAGVRLFDDPGAQPFELRTERVLAGPIATHLRYRVEAPATPTR